MVSLPGFSLPQESHGALKAAERRELALGQNINLMTHFILLGFSDRPHLERILFVVILIAYLLTLVGNTTIILVSRLDPHLHTPMYFFLAHLSFLDLSFTTSSIPQLLYNLNGHDKTIS